MSFVIQVAKRNYMFKFCHVVSFVTQCLNKWPHVRCQKSQGQDRFMQMTPEMIHSHKSSLKKVSKKVSMLIPDG